jgi:hypothetical protein
MAEKQWFSPRLYAALRAAKVPEVEAVAAAEEAAGFFGYPAFAARIVRLERSLKMLKLTAGANLTLILVLAIKVFLF